MSAGAYRSIVTPQFRKLLNGLPERVQQEAREGFERWKNDPRSVGWKALSGMHAPVYSVEIGRRYRAMGVLDKERQAVVWVFVGSHETYNRFIEIHRKTTLNNWVPPKVSERLQARRKSNSKTAAISPKTSGRPAPA